MQKKKIVALSLGMLLSAYHAMHARYLNYDTMLRTTAQLKALERNPQLVEAFEKELKQKYFRLLRPREYNKLYDLMLQLLDTADPSTHTKQLVDSREKSLHILDMIHDELKGLINKHGHRDDLIALCYRTKKLHTDISRGSTINPITIAEFKRSTQDLFAEILLNETTSTSVKNHIKKYLIKVEAHNKKNNEKKSQPKSDDKKSDQKRE